jgi:hypothetical protein
VRLFSSIENRHRVDDPDYEYVERDIPGLDIEPTDHTLSLGEALVAFVIPVAGLGLAIWRFGRGDIGPGFADLMLGGLGFVVSAVLFASHTI